MKVIEPYIEIIDKFEPKHVLKKIETIGRTCYKSEDKINLESSEKFIRSIIKSGHESVIEHFSISVKVVCDRGVSHEIVRHRIASYSQESTRYCNYSHDRFGSELTFIKPIFFQFDTPQYISWEKCMFDIEKTYFSLLECGCKPQEARSVLPNSLKTEIVMTMNLREWRHFFKLRTSQYSHPQMREISKQIFHEMNTLLPVFFEDISLKEE